MRARLAMALLLAACGGGSDQPDAAPPLPDAAPPPDVALPDAAMCSAPALAIDSPVTAGANADLYQTGPGAWLGASSAGAPPGDLLYVEAYDDLIDGDTVIIDGFENWAFECRFCLFLATGCPDFMLGVTDGQPDGAPDDCEALWMLDRATVTLSDLGVDPAAGRLAGEVTPISGEAAVRLVEVFATGDPQVSGGYGQKKPGAACLELPSLAFDASWGDGVDAGP